MADMTHDDILATPEDAVFDLPSGRRITRENALRLSANLGPGWADVIAKNDKEGMGGKPGDRTSMNAFEKTMMATGALSPEVSAVEGGIPLAMEAFQSIPQAGSFMAKLLAAARGTANLAGTGANIYGAVTSPETAVPGLVGARAAGKLAEAKNLGPTLTGLLTGGAGTAGMLAGGVAAGNEAPDLPTSLLTAGVGVGAPTGVGALAGFMKKNAAIPEALAQIEKATGKKLFSGGQVVAPTAEASLMGAPAQALQQGAPPLRVNPLVSTAEGLAFKQQVNALAKQRLAAEMELHNATLAAREADQGENALLRQQAKQRLMAAQQSVDTQRVQMAQKAEEFTKAKLDLPGEDLKATQLDFEAQRAHDRTVLAEKTGDKNQVSLDRVPSGEPLPYPDLKKIRQGRGAVDAVKTERLRVEGERLAAQDIQARDALARSATWAPTERAIAQTFARTPANQLGARIVEGGTDAYDVAARLAPQHMDAVNDAVINTLVNKAAGTSKNLNVHTLIDSLKDNAPLLQRAFPQFNSGEVKQRLDEVATVLAAVKPREVGGGSKTLDYMRSRGIWWAIEGGLGGAYAGSHGSSPAVVGGAAIAAAAGTEGVIAAGDKLIKTLLSNDDLRKSALSWAESSRAGRLTGDAGRAWLNYLGSFSKEDEGQ